jgi:ribosomal protein L37AE/L43A
MATRRSETCTDRFGQPIQEYGTKYEAEEAAKKSEIYGKKLFPYQCKKCGKWHLSPTDRSTPSVKCEYCRDSKGELKDLYETVEDAERRAEIILKEKGISLRIYKCPGQDGWHLTSS